MSLQPLEGPARSRGAHPSVMIYESDILLCNGDKVIPNVTTAVQLKINRAALC